jgi:3-hydroxyisobutyrate dehydrogenase
MARTGRHQKNPSSREENMNLAFIGMGTMGAHMAANLLKAGHQVTVHNRTREREEPVAAQGAKRADSPRQAAQGAEVVLLCVSDSPDVERVLFDDDGVAAGAAAGTVVVDMSTISPAVTVAAAKRLADKGIKLVDAPVSGGSEGAQKGTLAIMVGGDAADVEKVRPVLEAMGKNITHVGPIGSGQMTKAINQVILAGVYWGVAEGMVLGMKAGLDMDKVVDAIRGGAGDSWVLNYRASFMVKNDYPLGFRVSLHRKDLGIGLDTARDLGIALPVAGLVQQMENGLIDRGFGDEDVSAMARCLRELAGIK